MKGKERGKFEASVEEVGSGPVEALDELLHERPAPPRRRAMPPMPVPRDEWFAAAPDGPPRSERGGRPSSSVSAGTCATIACPSPASATSSPGLLFESDEHLSVDAIERRLKERGEHVGTATVYRTLEVLVESGLVRAHDFGEGFKRYEPMPRRPSSTST